MLTKLSSSEVSTYSNTRYFVSILYFHHIKLRIKYDKCALFSFLKYVILHATIKYNKKTSKVVYSVPKHCIFGFTWNTKTLRHALFDTYRGRERVHSMSMDSINWIILEWKEIGYKLYKSWLLYMGGMIDTLIANIAHKNICIYCSQVWYWSLAWLKFFLF